MAVWVQIRGSTKYSNTTQGSRPSTPATFCHDLFSGVCVCVCERDRQTDRQTETAERDRQTETAERDRDRQTDRQTDRQRARACVGKRIFNSKNIADLSLIYLISCVNSSVP